jgi:putative ABC transport system permease protein
MRRGVLLRTLLAEAVFATGLGGVGGIAFGAAMLLFFQRSMVYYLQTFRVDFAWPPVSEMVAAALVCAGLAAAVGLLGCILPAWRCSAEEPYLLINGEGL